MYQFSCLPLRGSGSCVATQFRLLVPSTSFTGLLAIAFNFAATTRSAGSRCGSPPAEPFTPPFMLGIPQTLFAVLSLERDKHGIKCTIRQSDAG